MVRFSRWSGACVLLGAGVFSVSGACSPSHPFGDGTGGSGGDSGSSTSAAGTSGATTGGSDSSSGAGVSTAGTSPGGGADSTTAGTSNESGGTDQGEAGAAAVQGGASDGNVGGNAGSAGTASAGNAGTAGAGGKVGLGAACNDKSECTSGNCADGVCCDAKCDGVCQACSAQGKCNEKPADDAACGNITCPSDTSCRDYPTAITSNRCASFGVCKKSDGCSFNVKNQGLACDPTHVCDGAGNCGPVVVCGATSCQIGPKECCAQTDKSIATCLDDGLTCAQGSDPAAPDTGMLISCDQTSDCPSGQACCWHSGRGSSGVFCKDPTQCIENAAGQYFEAVVCKSGAGSSTCPTGSCTGDVSGVTGWKYCK